MHTELSIALSFLVSYLYNKLPRRRVDVFAEELEKAYVQKFQDHWYPEEPFKGSGYRSIRIVEGKIDPLFKVASQLSGLSLEEILEHLPRGLTIWIDPDEVSYRIGETGQVTILYYDKRNTMGTLSSCLESVTPGQNLNGTGGFRGYSIENVSNPEQLNHVLNCFDSKANSNTTGSLSSYEQDLSLNLEKLRMESGSSLTTGLSYLNAPSLQNALQMNGNSNLLIGLPRSNNSNCFTAAAFAQTKFGSTKMKTHSNHHTRPTRLVTTATEFQSCFGLAAQMNALSARSPGSLLPFNGLSAQFHNSSWPTEGQSSAPSSCLSSPGSGFMPLSSCHLFPHLAEPSTSNTMLSSSMDLPRCSPNEIPSPTSLSSTHSLNGKSLVELATFNSDVTFQGKQRGRPPPSNHADNFNSSPTFLSSSSVSPSSEQSPPNTDAIEWNSYVSNHPNLHHLLVAN